MVTTYLISVSSNGSKMLRRAFSHRHSARYGQGLAKLSLRRIATNAGSNQRIARPYLAAAGLCFGAVVLVVNRTWAFDVASADSGGNDSQ